MSWHVYYVERINTSTSDRSCGRSFISSKASLVLYVSVFLTLAFYSFWCFFPTTRSLFLSLALYSSFSIFLSLPLLLDHSEMQTMFFCQVTNIRTWSSLQPLSRLPPLLWRRTVKGNPLIFAGRHAMNY